MPDQRVTNPVTTPQRYFLELVRGNDAHLEQAVEIPLVFFFENDPMPADHADWTLGSFPVEQHKGIRQRSLTLRGMSGLEKRTYTAINTFSGQTTDTQDGRTRFEVFQQFIEYYYAQAAEFRSAFVQNPQRWPKMIFRALKEGLSYYVRDIVLPPIEQAGRSRMTYEYTLTMTAIGEATRVVSYTIINDPSLAIKASEAQLNATLASVVNNQSINDSLIGPFTGPTNSLTPLPDSATPSLLQLLDELPGNMNQLRFPVESFLGRLQEYFGAVTNVATTAGGIPRSVIADLYAFSRQTIDDLNIIWDATSGTLRDLMRLPMLAFTYCIGDVGRALLRLLGSAGSKAPATTPQNISQPTSGSADASPPIGLEQVRQGEDVFAFALRVLGDVSRWVEIAALNAMTSASTLGDGSAFTAGVVLAIPAQAVSGLLTRPDAPQENVFGTDLAWNIVKWDYVPVGNPVRDIASITGPPNLQARLIHRFTKVQGSDLTAPGLGMPGVTGMVTSASLAGLIAAQALTQATADGAVKSLRSADFREVANIFEADLSIIPIAGQTLSFANVPIGISNGSP